jgi:hypothetical protein
MTQLPTRGVVQVFRLTDELGGLGLSCTPAGVSLAGVPASVEDPSGICAAVATLCRQPNARRYTESRDIESV